MHTRPHPCTRAHRRMPVRACAAHSAAPSSPSHGPAVRGVDEAEGEGASHKAAAHRPRGRRARQHPKVRRGRRWRGGPGEPPGLSLPATSQGLSRAQHSGLFPYTSWSSFLREGIVHYFAEAQIPGTGCSLSRACSGLDRPCKAPSTSSHQTCPPPMLLPLQPPSPHPLLFCVLEETGQSLLDIRGGGCGSLTWVGGLHRAI